MTKSELIRAIIERCGTPAGFRPASGRAARRSPAAGGGLAGPPPMPVRRAGLPDPRTGGGVTFVRPRARRSPRS